MNKDKPFQRIKKLLGYRSIGKLARDLQANRRICEAVDAGKASADRDALVELLVKTMESLSKEQRKRVMNAKFECVTFSTAIAGRLIVAAAIKSLNH